MAYIHVESGTYPLTADDIRALYPNTSFPPVFNPPEGFRWVFDHPVPEYDALTETVVEVQPVLTIKGEYERQWLVVPL